MFYVEITLSSFKRRLASLHRFFCFVSVDKSKAVESVDMTVVLYHHNSPCKKMYNKGPPPSAWAGLLNKPFSHFEKKRAFYFQF